MLIETAGGEHKLPFADEFRFLAQLFSRDVRLWISLENKSRGNKAWWRDAKKNQWTSVPWKTKW